MKQITIKKNGDVFEAVQELLCKCGDGTVIASDNDLEVLKNKVSEFFSKGRKTPEKYEITIR